MSRTIVSDIKRRTNAIPFRGQWFSDSLLVSNFLEDGEADGDLTDFADGGAAQVRIARPAKGDLVEARLTINAVAPVDAPTTLSIYIGDFDTDGLTPLVLSAEEIAARHMALTGFDEPYFYGSQDNIFIDGLNILPLIPKRGEAGFNEDAFIIGLDLSVKTTPAEFVLYSFKVDCTINIAEIKS